MIGQLEQMLSYGNNGDWPGYHLETPILARDGVEGQYGSRYDNQGNMEMPMY
jgi:hypothetical protein